MSEPPFLSRRTFGIRNYFLIALMMAFAVALIPRGTRKAIESNNNNARDWLPSSYPESADLRWFQHHFVGEQFALVSYDGCTLGNHESLTLLAEKLVPGSTRPNVEDSETQSSNSGSSESAMNDPSAAQPEDTNKSEPNWFRRVVTGPAMLHELTNGPQGFSRKEALDRLEGALFGPRKENARGELLPQESRTTCMLVTLTKEATATNKNMRVAIEKISELATEECGIPESKLRMGGPPVDNVAIDVEGERTLIRLALLSGIVGLTLSYWCFRSVKLTSMVFSVGVISAGMSLALVFYYGIIEFFFIKPARPLGSVDAILMSMPSVVYVLGLSGAIHIVNYYKDARRESGLTGAAESAIRHARGPCTLAALTTAVGLASLYISDIIPIKKFGAFTAVAVLGTLVILYTILPVALHRFPLSAREVAIGQKKKSGRFTISSLIDRVGRFVVNHHLAVCSVSAVAMIAVGLGLLRIDTSVQLLKLFDPKADIIKDYEWLENNLGNLVPMELVISIDPAQLRSGVSGEDSDAEANGERYRLSMLERVELIRRIQERTEQELPQVGKAMALSTFVPELDATGWLQAGNEQVLEESLHESRGASAEWVRLETDTADQVPDFHAAHQQMLEDSQESDDLYLTDDQSEPEVPSYTGRELWRISERVRALDDGQGGDIDYGLFVNRLRETVEPVLLGYQQRDVVLQKLHEQGKRLDSSKLLILFLDESAEGSGKSNALTEQEQLVRDLLREAKPPGNADNEVAKVNIAPLMKGDVDDAKLEKFRSGQLSSFDALIAVTEQAAVVGSKLAGDDIPLINLAEVERPAGSAANWVVESGDPQPLGAVYTGVVPLVYKTQRQLLVSLRESIMWATVLIAIVMVFVLRSVPAGIVAMLPNLFPIIMVFGALGWLGVKIDIGIMMTASVALGVAVDDTVHFVWWFQTGIREGMDRKRATLFAYERCGTAMTQTTIIAGLGLAVFGASTFTPTQQFGFLMITMLSTALVGDLLFLPAILAGPVGKFFSRRFVPATVGDTSGDAFSTGSQDDESGTKSFAPHSTAERAQSHKQQSARAS